MQGYCVFYFVFYFVFLFFVFFIFRDIDDWSDARNDFYDHLGCSQRECLYDASMDEILVAQTECKANKYTNGATYDIDMPWTPTIIPLSINKSSLLTQQPLFAFQNGNFVSSKWNVNIINGVNDKEAWLFVSQNMSEFDYNKQIDQAFINADDASKVKKEYSPLLVNSSYSNNMALLITDVMFKCPNHNASIYMKMNSDSSKTNTNSSMFFYHFNGKAWFAEYLLPEAVSQCWTRPCHATELPFVFRPNLGGLDYSRDINHTAYWNEPELEFAQGMQKYWGNFAKYDNPMTETINKKTTQWVEYGEPNREMIVFTVNDTKMVSNYDDFHCDFWSTLGYNWLSSQ